MLNGEHNRSLLSEVGVTPADYDKLLADGVLVESQVAKDPRGPKRGDP